MMKRLIFLLTTIFSFTTSGLYTLSEIFEKRSGKINGPWLGNFKMD